MKSSGILKNVLRKAEDAVEIDTTGLSIDEVIERVLKEIK